MRRPRSVSDFSILSHDRADLFGYDGGNDGFSDDDSFNYFGGKETSIDDVMGEGRRKIIRQTRPRLNKNKRKLNPFSAEAIVLSGGKSTVNPSQDLWY
jgi:hypothetical protein